MTVLIDTRRVLLYDFASCLRRLRKLTHGCFTKVTQAGWQPIAEGWVRQKLAIAER